MVWTSFLGLNAAFGVDGPAGCWTERYIIPVESRPTGWGENGFKKGYHKWWPSDGMKGKRHTEEAKQKMRDGCKKRDNSNMGRTNPITIDGVTYRSKMAAAKALNIPYTTFKRKYNGQ